MDGWGFDSAIVTVCCYIRVDEQKNAGLCIEWLLTDTQDKMSVMCTVYN